MSHRCARETGRTRDEFLRGRGSRGRRSVSRLPLGGPAGASAGSGAARGWLPPEAFEEVGQALDLTPAYCLAVGSFYDMFRLKPIGRHTVEGCTNICCGLCVARQVLEGFE